MPISVLKTIPTSAIVVVLSLLGTLTLRADPGVFDDRIVFGQSAALKGPAAALGLGMREGILAAFHEANTAGGVHGRKLDLISYKTITNRKSPLPRQISFSMKTGYLL